jgi:hypothetical protein
MQRHSSHVIFVIVVLFDFDTETKIAFRTNGICMELIEIIAHINVKMILIDMLVDVFGVFS